MKLRYERGALADLDEIFRYIAKDNRRAAAQLVARIEQATALIAEQPHWGATRNPKFRRFPIGSYLYTKSDRTRSSFTTFDMARGCGHGKANDALVQPVAFEQLTVQQRRHPNLHPIDGAGAPANERGSVGWHEVHGPQTDKWEIRKALPAARDHVGAIAHNGTIHIIGAEARGGRRNYWRCHLGGRRRSRDGRLSPIVRARSLCAGHLTASVTARVNAVAQSRVVVRSDTALNPARRNLRPVR